MVRYALWRCNHSRPARRHDSARERDQLDSTPASFGHFKPTSICRPGHTGSMATRATQPIQGEHLRACIDGSRDAFLCSSRSPTITYDGALDRARTPQEGPPGLRGPSTHQAGVASPQLLLGMTPRGQLRSRSKTIRHLPSGRSVRNSSTSCPHIQS